MVADPAYPRPATPNRPSALRYSPMSQVAMRCLVDHADSLSHLIQSIAKTREEPDGVQIVWFWRSRSLGTALPQTLHPITHTLLSEPPSARTA